MIGIIKQNIELSSRLSLKHWKELRNVVYPDWYSIKQSLGYNSYEWVCEKNKRLKKFCQYKNLY